MRRPCRIFATSAVSALFCFHPCVKAQMLSATTAPAQNWIALASSADGSRLVGAGSYGWIYLSTNSGGAWTAATTVTSGTEPERPWTGLASSSDGNRLVAVANFNPIFISTNSGLSWQQNGPAGVWTAAAMSSDGFRVVAVDHQGAILVSSDGGASWQQSSAPNRQWRSIACSADGTRIFAGSDFGTNYGDLPQIYASSDSGTTWTLTSAPAQPWQTITCSADGTQIAAAAYGGLIYLSNDSGTSWAPAAVPTLRWGGIASSTDGTRLIASAWEGQVYISSDSGHTWSQANGPAGSWLPVACSADGINLFVGIWDMFAGGIYTAQLAPVLHIAPNAGGTVVSWASPANGYVLQQCSNITSTTWSAVGVVPTTVNGQQQVVFPLSGGLRAYRLVKGDTPQNVTGGVTSSALRPGS